MKPFFQKLLLIWLGSIVFSTTHPAIAKTQTASTNREEQLTKIQNYLNGIDTLRANFAQNQNGNASNGKMYIKRFGRESFGKLRLEYAPPTNTKIIANGEVLRIVDGETKDVSEYSIDSTPASFLLRHRIDFSNDLNVKSLETKGDKIYLTVNRPGENGVTLTLIFVTSPILRLQEWSVLDPQNNITHVVLKQVEIGIPLEEKLFRF